MKLFPPPAEDVARVPPLGGADAFAAPSAVLASFAPWVEWARARAEVLARSTGAGGADTVEMVSKVVRALAPAMAGRDDSAAPWRAPLQAWLAHPPREGGVGNKLLAVLRAAAAATLADAPAPPARWAEVLAWAQGRSLAAEAADHLEKKANKIGAEAAARAGAPAGLGELLAEWVRHLAACLRDAPAEDWPENLASTWVAGVLARAEAKPDEWRRVLEGLEAEIAAVAPDEVGWKIGRILLRLGEAAAHFAWAGALGRADAELARRLDAPAARRGLAWRPLLRGAAAAVLAGEVGTLRRLAFRGDACFGGASAEEWAAFAGELTEACRPHGGPASSEALAAVLAGAAEALALGEARRGADLALARAAGEFLRRGPRRGLLAAAEAEQAEQQLIFLADLAIRARATHPHRAAAHAALRSAFEGWLVGAPRPGVLAWREDGPALAAAWLGALREALGARHRLLAALDAALRALRPLDSAARAGRASPAHNGAAAQNAARHLWTAGSAPDVVQRKEGLLLRRLALDATAISPVVPQTFAEAWDERRRGWFPAERAAILGRLRGVVAELPDAPVAGRLRVLLDEAAEPVAPPAATSAVSAEPREVAPVPAAEPPLSRDEASAEEADGGGSPAEAGSKPVGESPAVAAEMAPPAAEKITADRPVSAAEAFRPSAETASETKPSSPAEIGEPAPPKDEVDLFLASAATLPPEERRSSPVPFVLRRSGPPPGALLSFSPAMFAPPMTRLVDLPPRPPRPAPTGKPAPVPSAPVAREGSPPTQEKAPPPPAASSPPEPSPAPGPDAPEGSAIPAAGVETPRQRTVNWPPGLADAPPVVRPVIRAEAPPAETALLPAAGAAEPSTPAASPPVAEDPEPVVPPPPPGPAWPTFAPPVFPPRFMLTEQVLAAPSLDWRTRARALASRLLESAHEAAVQRAARWRGMEAGALGDKLAALNVIIADGLAPAEWSGCLDPDAEEGWVAWLDSQPPELWRAAEDWLVALGTEAAAPNLGFTGRLRLLDYLGLLREFHRQAAMVREVASALAATGEPDALRMAGVLMASLGRGSGPAAIWRLHRLALEQFDAPPDAAALSARAGLTPDQTRCLFAWLESLEVAGDTFAQGVCLRVWLGGEKAASDLPAADDREALFLFAALASACAGSKPALAAQLRLWAAGTLPELDGEAGRATWGEIFARLPVRLPPEGLPAVRSEWDALRRALESFDRLREMTTGLASFEANLRDALGDALAGDAHALARRQLPAALLLIARETAAPLAPPESGRTPTPLRFTEDEAWRALTRIPPAADRALVEMLRGGAADSPEAALWVLFRRLASERVALESAFGEVGSFRMPRVADLPLTTAALERQWRAAPSPAGELAALAARRECLATWLHPGGSAKAPAAPLPAGSAPLDELAHRHQQLFTRLAGSLKLPTPMRERFQVLVRRLPALTAAARLRGAFPNAAASPAAALATVVADALEENRRCQLTPEDATRLDEAVRDVLSREETAALTNAVSPGTGAFGEPSEPDPTQWRAWRLTQLLRG